MCHTFALAIMGEQAIDDRGKELLEKTSHLFMRFGIKSMTMDDISRQLGVSKKTLYLYVSDKNDLVYKVMRSIIEGEKALVNHLAEQHENAIDMLFEMSREMSQKFAQIHPSINYDMQKYHPEAWSMFEKFKNEFIAGSIAENLVKGIEQGLFRGNLNPYIISRLYAAKMDMCTDSELFPADKYTFPQIHLELMRYHIRGVASEAGLKYLAEKVKKENYQL